MIGMYKRVGVFLFSLFFLLFSSSTTVNAQDNLVSVWNCLPAKRDGIDKIKLFQKDLNEKGTIYIVDCIGTPKGSYCTTGDINDDQKLKIGFEGVEAPFRLDNKQALKEANTTNFTATVDFSKAPLHTFYYVYLAKTDAAKTIKFSSINFTNSTCANTVFAIPDYRFFDIASLEPLSDIRITLLDAGGVAMVPSQVTRADGAYYYLHADRNLQFKIEMSNDYSFYNEVSHGKIKGYKDNFQNFVKKIYSDTDIPLVPSTSPRIKAPEGVFYTTEKFDSYTRSQGRVSIPYSNVVFSQNNTEVARVKADKYGDYSIKIDNKKINTEETLQMSYVKANLQSSDVSNVKGIAVNNGPEIIPISGDIEGYVYDKAGNIIPEGIIDVMVRTSDKVYYTQRATKDGYFKILADKLPKFEYYLDFRASQESINTYNYSDPTVQRELVDKIQAKTTRDFEQALQKKLLEGITYSETASIFMAQDAATIAKKRAVISNQKSISIYMLRKFVDNGEVGHVFGRDLNQVPKSEFETKVKNDLSNIFKNTDIKFVSEFSRYFADLSYSSDISAYVSNNNKDAFVDSMSDRFVIDIFRGNTLLSQANNNISGKVLAATTKTTAFNQKYFTNNILSSVALSLGHMANGRGDVDLGKALAQSGKILATKMISDSITNATKDPAVGGFLGGTIGGLISGQDIGRSVTNAARMTLINQGQRLLTNALVNPATNTAGNAVSRGISGDIAGPVAGFVTTFITTGDVKSAVKSAASQLMTNLLKKPITSFFSNMLGGILPKAWIGGIASIAVAVVISLLMSLFGSCS